MNNSILNVTNGFSENIHLNKLGIFSSLKTLILNGNKIESIKNIFTKAFEFLEKLNLENNMLSFVIESAFSNLKNLKELYLSDNSFLTLDNNCLIGLPKSLKISNLIISESSISKLTSDIVPIDGKKHLKPLSYDFSAN